MDFSPFWRLRSVMSKDQKIQYLARFSFLRKLPLNVWNKMYGTIKYNFWNIFIWITYCFFIVILSSITIYLKCEQARVSKLSTFHTMFVFTISLFFLKFLLARCSLFLNIHFFLCYFPLFFLFSRRIPQYFPEEFLSISLLAFVKI
jgi:hypothetical protein